MFTNIAPRYDLLNAILSLGLHYLWQRKLVSLIPSSSGREKALDLCTGTGALVPDLANRFNEVFAVDLSEGMLLEARKRVIKGGKVNWIQGDAQNLSFEAETFDLVTIAYGARNFADLKVGLAEVARVLKPNGILLILEFGQPKNKIWRNTFAWYARHIIPILGGVISGDSAAYTYLPETIASFPSGEAFAAILKSVGLECDKIDSLCGGVGYIYRARFSAILTDK